MVLYTKLRYFFSVRQVWYFLQKSNNCFLNSDRLRWICTSGNTQTSLPGRSNLLATLTHFSFSESEYILTLLSRGTNNSRVYLLGWSQRYLSWPKGKGVLYHTRSRWNHRVYNNETSNCRYLSNCYICIWYLCPTFHCSFSDTVSKQLQKNDSSIWYS